MRDDERRPGPTGDDEVAKVAIVGLRSPGLVHKFNKPPRAKGSEDHGKTNLNVTLPGAQTQSLFEQFTYIS